MVAVSLREMAVYHGIICAGKIGSGMGARNWVQ